MAPKPKTKPTTDEEVGLLDEIEVEEAELNRLRLQARLDDKTREFTAAKTLIRELQADIDRLAVVDNFLKTPIVHDPSWAKMPKKVKSGRGIAGLLLSDLHLDEVVLPGEMMGKNAYNREIAEMRLLNIFENFISQMTFYHSGTEYDGAVVFLGGDLVNGEIHEEFRETNEFPMPETIRFWTPKIASGLKMIADVFGHVLVASVPGNHGRYTAKPRYKKRTMDNADWLMSVLIAERLAEDPRFEFNIPDAMETFVQVYDQTILLTHGDQVGGGGGIGGIFSPVMRMKAKKQNNYVFNWLMMGHFHQYIHTQGITVNNSLKGWDEYALGHSFPFDEPSQAAFIFTPEHGTTWPVEVYCQDKKAEGWA